MSPDLLLEANPKHTWASDVWAWACTAFEVMHLLASSPFRPPLIPPLILQILTDSIPYSGVNGEHQIIMAMLRKESPGGAETPGKVLRGRWPAAFSRGLNLQPLLSTVSASWSFTSSLRPTIEMVMLQVFPLVDSRYGFAYNGVNYIGSVHVLCDQDYKT